jgi:hypothetical protein
VLNNQGVAQDLDELAIAIASSHSTLRDYGTMRDK